MDAVLELELSGLSVARFPSCFDIPDRPGLALASV